MQTLLRCKMKHLQRIGEYAGVLRQIGKLQTVALQRKTGGAQHARTTPEIGKPAEMRPTDVAFHLITFVKSAPQTNQLIQ